MERNNGFPKVAAADVLQRVFVVTLNHLQELQTGDHVSVKSSARSV